MFFCGRLVPHQLFPTCKAYIRPPWLFFWIIEWLKIFSNIQLKFLSLFALEFWVRSPRKGWKSEILSCFKFQIFVMIWRRLRSRLYYIKKAILSFEVGQFFWTMHYAKQLGFRICINHGVESWRQKKKHHKPCSPMASIKETPICAFLHLLAIQACRSHFTQHMLVKC